MYLPDTTDKQKEMPVVSSKCRDMTKEKLELNGDNPARSDEELDKIVLATSAALAHRAGWYAHLAASNNQQTHETNETTTSEESTNKTNAELNRLLQPKRPMNAFMVWGQSIRRELHNRYTNVQNAMLSKSLGRVWKQLDLEEKLPYIERASAIKANHKRDYPNYRYQPRRMQEKLFRQQQEASPSSKDLHHSLALDACSSSGESSISFQQATPSISSTASSTTALVDDLQGCLSYVNDQQTHCVALEAQYISQTDANNGAVHHQATELNYDTHPNGSIIYYSQTASQEHHVPSTDCHIDRVFVEQPRHHHQPPTVEHHPVQYQSYEQQQQQQQHQALVANGITYSISGQPDEYACNTDRHMGQGLTMIEASLDYQQQQRLFDYQQHRLHVDEPAGW